MLNEFNILLVTHYKLFDFVCVVKDDIYFVLKLLYESHLEILLHFLVLFFAFVLQNLSSFSLVSIHQFLELLDIAKEFENSLELTSPE
jgi:hypothetical protein